MIDLVVKPAIAAPVVCPVDRRGGRQATATLEASAQAQTDFRKESFNYSERGLNVAQLIKSDLSA